MSNYNIILPNGATSASKPDAGGAVVKSVPVFGVVKDNIDTVRSGRLRVYISDMGGPNPDIDSSWVTVNYMSPFFGATQGTGAKTGYGTYLQNPSSYGMWNSPPDIGSIVICVFINGDPNYGYWIGCVPQPETLYMVPAIGASETVVLNDGESNAYGGATRLPVANINANNSKVDKSLEFWDQPKPVHSYLASILAQQGLLRDSIRGAIGTSSQRESPSRVGWGVSTPGRPIYDGGYDDVTIKDNLDAKKADQLKIISRRGGHSVVMDDGDISGKDQLVRIRSSLGHQILMSDDGQCLFIIHANGQSWVELGREGTIDMYASNSVNIRTQGDLNLHADNNININAKNDLNIYGKNINVNSDEKTNWRTGADFALQTLGKFGINAKGSLSLKTGGDASLAGDGNTFVNGAKVNLNTGSSSFTPEEVTPITIIAHTDTLFDGTKGWAAAPGKLLSVVSRAPAHAPWANANQGVDVKVNNSADANFPSAPSSAVASTNNFVPSTPDVPVSAAAAATVPGTGAIGGTLDKNVTATMVSQVAAVAQTGPAAAAISAGSGIVNTATGPVAAIGQLAQSPQQLENAGVIKPGSAALVSSLVKQGVSIDKALSANMFTGKPGAENLSAFQNNPLAQVNTQVANFQKAQSGLTQAGIITGKEAPSQVAGLITAATSIGVASTVSFVTNATKTLGSVGTGLGLSAPISGFFGSVANNISSGNFAANLATNITGGLSSLTSSLSGLAKNPLSSVTSLLESAKGLAGAAFAAVTNGFPKLKAGEPQNLKQIVDKAVAVAQSAGSTIADAAKSAGTTISNLGSKAISLASGESSSATGSQLSTATSTSELTPSQLKWLGNADPSDPIILSRLPPPLPGELNGDPSTQATQVATSTLNATLPGNTSTGIGNLPGGGSSIASVVNNGVKALNTIPGASKITGAISSITAAVNTGSLSGSASSLLAELKKPGSSLQALASVGLSPTAMVGLNAAIAALSSGGPSAIKLPTVATNTTDRSSITTSIASVLGSTKIPAPNYSSPIASYFQNETAKLQEREAQKAVLSKASDAQYQIATEAKTAYQTAINNLPEGDPGIAEARKKYYEEKSAFIKKSNELTDFIVST
jgi:hypothetical protein